MVTEYGWKYRTQDEALVEKHLARFLKGHCSARFLAGRIESMRGTFSLC